MKPALVLGLALAANAMTADSGDNNELFVAPTGKLAEFAKKHPGIMFDEQADDELAVKYVHLPHIPAPEYVAYDDDELLIRPLVPHIAADDELAVKIANLPEYIAYDDEELFFAPGQRIGNLAGPYPTLNFDEQADDELLVQPVQDFSRYRTDVFGKILKDGIGRPLPPVLARFDEVADDELRAFHTLPKDEFGNVIRPPYARFDEVADDELAINQQIVQLPTEFVAFDDDELMRGIPPVENFKSYEDWLRFTRKMSEEADDELLVQPVQDLSRYRTDVFGKILKDGIGRPLPPVLARFDEVADDELRIRPISVLPTQHVAFDDDEFIAKLPREKFITDSQYYGHKVADDELRIRPISVLPTAENVAFDDELSFMPIPPKVFVNRDWVKPAKIPASEALIRDDEADDELAYLGQLINDRAFVRTFDDYELRAEKPSHLKAQEMAHMKSELPKMKRKLRPLVDEVPLTQN